MSEPVSPEPAVDEPAKVGLRIVRGDATPEEVAALVAVLAASGGGDEVTTPQRRRSGWSDPAARLGTARSWTSLPR